MQRDVALWIDHRQAVIAVVTGDTEDLTRILSGIEKHVRFSPGEGGAAGAVEVLDRLFRRPRRIGRLQQRPPLHFRHPRRGREVMVDVDALGVAVDPRDKSVVFGIGTTDFTNAYVVNPDKELRRVAEPLITLGKTPTLANRRLAFDRLRDRDARDLYRRRPPRETRDRHRPTGERDRQRGD